MLETMDILGHVRMDSAPAAAHDGRRRTFKPYDLDQSYLLPPDLRSWLSEGHLALFVSDVVDALDLSPILDAYERGDGRGYPPYHPVMMLKLLVYGYCTGKISSRKIEKATWYFNPDAITDERLASVDLYVATARERKPSPLAGSPPVEPSATAGAPELANSAAPAPATVVQRMRAKLATEAGKAVYKLRKCIPEPVFGQIKEGRGFRRFSFRGLAKVTAEWSVVALTHNLLKLFRSGWRVSVRDRLMETVNDAMRGA